MTQRLWLEPPPHPNSLTPLSTHPTRTAASGLASRPYMHAEAVLQVRLPLHVTDVNAAAQVFVVVAEPQQQKVDGGGGDVC